MEQRQQSGHIRALDGLRGSAVLLVFVYHALSSSLVATDRVSLFARRATQTGWVGVDLFFVLSGFLITSILLDARLASNYFRVFYARRVLRILPLYYLVLVAALVLMPGHFGWRIQIFYWLSLSNLPTAFHPLLIPYLAHFWSLAVEEQFYLVWPALVFLLRPRALAFVCLGVISGICVLRNLPFILALNQRFPEFVYRFTALRVDTLCAGALLAVAIRKIPGILRMRVTLRITCIVFGLAFLSVGFGKPYDTEGVIRIGYSALLICFSALVALTLGTGSTARLFSNGFLRRMGKYSYAFYLFHPFLINAVAFHLFGIHRKAQQFGLGRWSFNLVLLPIVFAEGSILFGVCSLSWRFLESPILRQKHRFEYEYRGSGPALQRTVSPAVEVQPSCL